MKLTDPALCREGRALLLACRESYDPERPESQRAHTGLQLSNHCFGCEECWRASIAAGTSWMPWLSEEAA